MANSIISSIGRGFASPNPEERAEDLDWYAWDWSQVVLGTESRYRNAWAKAVTFHTRYGVRPTDNPRVFLVPGQGTDLEEVIEYRVIMADWGLVCNCDAGRFCSPCYHGAGLSQHLGLRYGVIG